MEEKWRKHKNVYTLKEWVYDAATLAGKITQYKEKLTSSVWAETDYEYEDNDAPCKPSEITDALDQVTTIDYNSNGQVASVTRPTSASGFTTKTTNFTYDGTTKSLIRMSNGEGNETTFTNNSNGIPSSINSYQGTYDTGSLVGSIGKTFNAVGQVTATTNSVTNETTSATFTNNGALSAASSAMGCSTTNQLTTQVGGNDYAAPSGVSALTPAKDYSAVILPGDPRYGNGSNDVPLGSGQILPPSIASYRPNIFSTTNAQNHATTYEYNDDGSVLNTSNHLGQVTAFDQDAFGRTDEITSFAGKTTSYVFNLNSQVTTKSEEGRGNVIYGYDNAGRLVSVIDPMRGTMVLDRSINGSISSDEMGDYSYDYSGRKTQLSYTGGGSDNWDYNQDGQLSGINEFDFTYDRTGNLDEWSDGTNDATFSYSGSEGSTALGLPSSVAGTGNIGDYSYGYTSRYWLDALEDTSKTGQDYTYSYSSSKELNQLDYPNDQRLSQTYTNKKLDQIQLKKPADQEYLLSTDTTFNGNDEVTAYTATVKESGSNTFTETNTLSYDQNHRLSTLIYGSNNRTITFGYDANNGKLTSKSYSDINGSFGISYSAQTGNISSISYPAGLGGGNEVYVYEANGRGRLTTITYPNQDTLTFSWSNKDQISDLTFDDGTTVTSYSLTYNGLGKLSSYTKTEDSYEIETWNFTYGPHGLEYAEKVVNSEAVITQDFTTDPYGRILSMTYYQEDAEEGVNGEYYFHYDNFGNTAMLTDASGNRQFAALYDINNGKMVDEWNPNGLAFANKGEGENSRIFIELPNSSTQILFLNEACNNIIKILSPYILPLNVSNLKTSLKTLSENIQGKHPELVCPFECGYTSCQKLFDGDSGNLRVDFDPSVYNCSLMICCRSIYSHSKNNLLTGVYDDGGFNVDHIVLDIDNSIRDKRFNSMNDWYTKNEKECDDILGPLGYWG